MIVRTSSCTMRPVVYSWPRTQLLPKAVGELAMKVSHIFRTARGSFSFVHRAMTNGGD